MVGEGVEAGAGGAVCQGWEVSLDGVSLVAWGEEVGRRTGSWKSLILMAFWLQASTRAGCEGLGQETCVEEEKLAELHGPECGVLAFN